MKKLKMLRRKLKVLFFCEGLNETSVRAQPWRHIIEIAKRIKSLGNDVQVFSDYSRKHESDEVCGLPLERIKRKGLLLDIDDFAKSIREKDMEIVNWHGSDTWSSFYLSRLGKCEPGRVVWTLHSGPISKDDLRNLTPKEMLQLHRYWNNLFNAVFPSPVIRKWIRCAEIKLIIALSQRLSKHLTTIGVGVSNISVIPSGVDTKRFNPQEQEEARESLKLPKEESIILYYGPLSSFRGVDTLIEAASLIKKKIPSFKLVLLGRGPETNIKLPMQLGKAWIEVKSDVFSEDVVVQYLDAADIVALPFRFWPQVECPLTVLESMAMEKALVTTSVGAISEIVQSGKNGILVHPRNPFMLAEKSIELLEDAELRRHMGVNARKRVQNHFDWDIIVKQTLRAFEEALKKD